MDLKKWISHTASRTIGTLGAIQLDIIDNKI
jgi:hypothetical protein